MSTKQVIVVRRDLKMRRGEEIAQGSHASMAFITRNLSFEGQARPSDHDPNPKEYHLIPLSEEEVEWLKSSFTKVCVRVNSEEELLAVVEKAKAAGLTVHLITDSGKTEFKNMATATAVAIGPHLDEKFIGVTDNLQLY